MWRKDEKRVFGWEGKSQNKIPLPATSEALSHDVDNDVELPPLFCQGWASVLPLMSSSSFNGPSWCNNLSFNGILHVH